MTTTALHTTVKTADATIKTVTSAERFLVTTMVDISWYGTHPEMRTWIGDIAKVQKALGEFTGETPTAIATRLADRVQRSHAARAKESARIAKKLGLA